MTDQSQQDISRPVRQFVGPVETALRADMTVAQSLSELRSRRIEHGITYFYAVDENGRLLGVVPARKLLLSEPGQRLGDVMIGPAVSVQADAPLEDAMELFAMHRLLALPVVERDGRLIGQIDVALYAEEALDLGEKRRLDDLFQLMGLSVQPAKRAAAKMGFRRRMPWLLCNIAGGLACALIAAFFRVVLDRVVLLEIFIPVVLTLSEAVSMQSMTIGLQNLRGSQVRWRALLARGLAEWRTVGLLGLVSAAIVGAAGLLVAQGPRPMLVIAASVAISMTAAAAVGTTLPALLHAMKLDPKVAAGPVVLAACDVVTTATYLALASWWLL